MIELLCCCVLFAAFLLMAIKMDKVVRSIRDFGDRLFAQEQAYRAMERASNVLAGKVDHVAEHFTYPSIAEPVPLPGLEEETAAEKKPKKRRAR